MIQDCYEKARYIPDLQTNDCALEILKESHKSCTTGCPNCDLYFYCTGNFNAMQCEEPFHSSMTTIGDKEKTIKYLNLCIEEAYLRGTQESYLAKQAGKSGSSVGVCDAYLEQEGCNFDPDNPSQNRAMSNEEKDCYGELLLLLKLFIIMIL